MTERVFEIFPALDALEPEARAYFLRSLHPVEVPQGSVLFHDGTACNAFLLVLSGAVRVQKIAENGREIVLYRVEPGQTCILTSNCLLSGNVYGADGVAETALSALTIAPVTFRRLAAESETFRQFVFSAYATRVSDLLMVIEEVAFRRVDVRLAEMLLDRAEGGEIRATHQDLAVELGTAREVISRQLKEFERRGWVRLARGRITVVDRAGVSRFCDAKAVV